MRGADDPATRDAIATARQQPRPAMSVQHRDLAAGRWWTVWMAEQLGNIGSEVSRAARWSLKNPEKAERALHRCTTSCST